MGSGCVHISPLPVPYPYYEIGKNPNPIKSGKTRQIGVGLGGYPWAWVLLPCLHTAAKTPKMLGETWLQTRLRCFYHNFNIFTKRCGKHTCCLLLFIREPKQTEERHQPCRSSIEPQIHRGDISYNFLPKWKN